MRPKAELEYKLAHVECGVTGCHHKSNKFADIYPFISSSKYVLFVESYISI